MGDLHAIAAAVAEVGDGTPTLGLHTHMSAEVYHAIQAMSAGGLKRMRKSPAHFFGLQLDERRPPSGPPSPVMLNGTLVHCDLFEPDEFADRYTVRPADIDGRTKEGKAWLAANQGRQVIDAGQRAASLAQANAIRAVPELAGLLSSGYGESSAFWRDDVTGALCKCRPDWVHPAGNGVILVDGKTTVDASPEGFARKVASMDYHLQAAWYSDGFERATGLHVHGFVFAVVESAWPHPAMAYMLDEETLDAGRREYRRLLNLYAECMRTGHWPTYGTGINLLHMPRWANLETLE